jgi:hypothetical protein
MRLDHIFPSVISGTPALARHRSRSTESKPLDQDGVKKLTNLKGIPQVLIERELDALHVAGSSICDGLIW